MNHMEDGIYEAHQAVSTKEEAPVRREITVSGGVAALLDNSMYYDYVVSGSVTLTAPTGNGWAHGRILLLGAGTSVTFSPAVFLGSRTSATVTHTGGEGSLSGNVYEFDVLEGVWAVVPSGY